MSQLDSMWTRKISYDIGVLPVLCLASALQSIVTGGPVGEYKMLAVGQCCFCFTYQSAHRYRAVIKKSVCYNQGQNETGLISVKLPEQRKNIFLG